MEKFTRLTATACPMPFTGIDTDQLIPARFMNRTREEGYGPYLLHDLRQQPGFPLNDPRYTGAAILIARRNFGGGSSREAAVYALADFGIRCVIAPSFGDIFAANAVGNGLLPAVAAEPDVEAMLEAATNGAGAFTVDLAARTIAAGNHVWDFTLNDVWREKLLHGWDDIDLTRRHQSQIDAFVTADKTRRAWAWLEA
jgi:3-isopropylmalate/(R)-2-methylmalate dehydratase small subunit